VIDIGFPQNVQGMLDKRLAIAAAILMRAIEGKQN
jgi:hypothetical protein